MHWAAGSGLVAILRLLVEAGADVNAADNKGELSILFS